MIHYIIALVQQLHNTSGKATYPRQWKGRTNEIIKELYKTCTENNHNFKLILIMGNQDNVLLNLLTTVSVLCEYFFIAQYNNCTMCSKD